MQKIPDSKKLDKQSSQQRETNDPSERQRPIPALVGLITLTVALSGVAYILLSEPFGDAEMGDRRTLADLRPALAAAPGAVVNGKQVFSVNCAACHQANGKGLAGVFPPLDGSEWVVGDTRTLANILLHGVSGELVVMGNTYNGAMPAFKQLGDAELAAVTTYIRSEWSNKAPALTPEMFETERKADSRTTPFKGGEELKTLTSAKAS
ncbi:Cytochrome c-552 [Polaromonas vacuolata]|uniref:Cytochrome c-552 n=1 Tax=Polaromonas vacuolata TaxID=37448 RepID=A0A6H2HB64_9BURK|nr:cytochrome c [Polaromonas vacuolata]QJC57118.1 Cytochrome c-552 [Polaromonas vacuolata]